MHKRIIFRRIWYIKRRNLHAINLCTRLFLAGLGIILAFLLISSALTPALKEETERCVNARMKTVIEETVRTAFSDNSINNSELFISYDKELYEYDQNYKNDAEVLNLMDSRLDRLSVFVAERIRLPESINVSVPLGNISGLGVFYGYGQGPLLKANIVAVCNTKASCTFGTLANRNTNAVNDSILRIAAEISYHGLLISGSTEVVCFIPVYLSE